MTTPKRLNTHTSTESARWFCMNMPAVRPEKMRNGGSIGLREYAIHYRVVPSVDGQGETCRFCQERNVQANVYVRLMNGDEEMEQTCTGCVLPVIDGHLDTDPSYIVTVEQPQ
jgi:hypothetical protein